MDGYLIMFILIPMAGLFLLVWRMVSIKRQICHKKWNEVWEKIKDFFSGLGLYLWLFLLILFSPILLLIGALSEHFQGKNVIKLREKIMNFNTDNPREIQKIKKMVSKCPAYYFDWGDSSYYYDGYYAYPQESWVYPPYPWLVDLKNTNNDQTLLKAILRIKNELLPV